MSTARRAAAIRRARVLAGLLLATTISWLGAALSLLPTTIAVVATTLLVADLVALRSVAKAREAARSRHPSAARQPARASAADGVAARPDGGTVEVRAAPAGGRRPLARTAGAPLRRTLPPAEAARRPAARRVGERAAEAAEAAEAGRPTSDGTWMPIPVPPPTYTLKPMAPRPEPPALEIEGGRPTSPAGPGGVGSGAAATGAGGGAGAARVAGGGGAGGAGGAGGVAGGGGIGATGATVIGSEGIAPPPGGQVPERYEGVEPSAAQERPAKRPWDDDREFADELDLDAVLARRRAVNG
jgi:hypothetical protein